MKTIGLIGGMSWESTVTYYQAINTEIKRQYGGLHSARCILYSVDFQIIKRCQSRNLWDESAKILADAAQRLEAAGADYIVICSNTMHKVFDQVQAKISIPILHIATPTIAALKEAKITKVGLLGTQYTTEEAFYQDKLIEAGLSVVVPDDLDREMLNDIIFEELCLGRVLEPTKKELLRMIEELKEAGAEAVILGCTELGMLINQHDTDMLLFDTTLLHATEAAIQAIEDIHTYIYHSS